MDAAAAVAPVTDSWLDFLKGLVPANMLGIGTTTSDDGVAISFNVRRGSSSSPSPSESPPSRSARTPNPS